MLVDEAKDVMLVVTVVLEEALEGKESAIVELLAELLPDVVAVAVVAVVVEVVEVLVVVLILV